MANLDILYALLLYPCVSCIFKRYRQLKAQPHKKLTQIKHIKVDKAIPLGMPGTIQKEHPFMEQPDQYWKHRIM